MPRQDHVATNVATPKHDQDTKDRTLFVHNKGSGLYSWLLLESHPVERELIWPPQCEQISSWCGGGTSSAGFLVKKPTGLR